MIGSSWIQQVPHTLFFSNNNETWSLSWLSFNIQAMVETSINCFSHVSNDILVDRYIKWNNSNHFYVILNVDDSCVGSPVRYGFGGITRNIFRHYLADFLGFIWHFARCLSIRVSCWPKTWTLIKLSATRILYTVSTSSKVPKLDIIFMLYWFKIWRSCSLRPMFLYITHLDRGIDVLISSLNLELPQMLASRLTLLFHKAYVIFLRTTQWEPSFSVNSFFS
jgi:hypothetical protein